MGLNGRMEAPPGWDQQFFRGRKEAPCPVKIVCERVVEGEGERPAHLGAEYHGLLTARQTEAKLTQEGAYLLRQGRHPPTTTLSFRANGSVHHYHLHYDGRFFVRPEKKFPVLEELVAEGLQVHYLQQRHYPSNQQQNSEKQDSGNPFSQQKNLQPESNEQPLTPRTRRHLFKPHVFGWFERCSVCSSWQFGQQGVKCQACGYGAHLRCSEALQEGDDVCEALLVFGAELVAQAEASPTGCPFIVDMCIEEIERRGLDAEGLYRVSGFSDEIHALSQAFQRDGERADISPAAYDSVHVITGVLKRWLRQLPQPLIPTYAYAPLCQALKEDSDSEMARVLLTLPHAHYVTLHRVLSHLRRVVADPRTNRMTDLNMAVVFGPTLVRSGDLATLSTSISLVQRLINTEHLVFDTSMKH